MIIRTLLASCLILFVGTGLAQEPARKVIEWGWDEPDTKFIRENIGMMEQHPFDAEYTSETGPFSSRKSPTLPSKRLSFRKALRANGLRPTMPQDAESSKSSV